MPVVETVGLSHAFPNCRRLDVDRPAACARRLSAVRAGIVSRAADTQRTSNPAPARHPAGGCCTKSGCWRGTRVWCGVTSPLSIPRGSGGGGGGGGKEPHRGRPLGLSGGKQRLLRPCLGSSSVWPDVTPSGTVSYRALGSHGSGDAEEQEEQAAASTAAAAGGADPPVSSRGEEENPFDDWQVCM